MAFTNMFLNGLVMLKKLCNVFSNSIFFRERATCDSVLKKNLTAFLVMVQPNP